jgi:hypothetical protein
MSERHPRIAEVIDALERSRNALRVELDALTPEQRVAPGADGRWSVAENVEHLAITEDGIGRLISKLIKELRAADARETDSTPIGPTMDGMRLDRNITPRSAPELVRPQFGWSVSESWERLDTARTRVIAAYEAASGLALHTLTAPHPALGPLSVYQWGHMLALHLDRHRAQIRDTVTPPVH